MIALSTDEEIHKFFYDCGVVQAINKQLNEASKWTGACHIKFSSEAELNSALELNDAIWTGSGGDGTRCYE